MLGDQIGIDGWFGKITELSKNKTLFVDIIIISVLVIIGELLSFTGELIINFFFNYNPLRLLKKNNVDRTCEYDSNIEKVVPCANEYIVYEDFEKFAYEMSEVHFVMSRTLAGLFIVFLVHMLYFILFSFKYTIEILDYILNLPIFIFAVFLLLFVLISFIYTYRPCCKLNLVAILIPLVILCLFLIYKECLYSQPINNKCDQIKIHPFLLAILTISSFLGALYYRAHANKLIFFNRKTNGLSKRDQNIHKSET